MDIIELESEIKDLELERENLFAKQKIINNNLFKNFNQLQKMRTEKEKLEEKTPEWYLECKNGQETEYRYKEMSKKIKSFSLGHNGYSPISGQRILHISAYKHNDINKQLLGLEYFIPALRKTDIGNGGEQKYLICVMAPDLSLHHSYVLVSDDKKTWELTDIIHKHWGLSFSGDIKKCLEYIHKNLNMDDEKDYGDE